MNNKIKVLVIDDSVTSRTLIAKYLNDKYECLMANNGEDGWNTLVNDDSITLVFADMHMPKLNGMLLLKRIRESGIERIASLPVIIITGHEDSVAARKACYTIGATDFISKPFIRDDILTCAGSYTTQVHGLTTTQTDIARNVLSELDENPIFSNIGKLNIASAQQEESHTSILYLQVAHLEQLIRSHGDNLIDRVSKEIRDLLERSLRKEEVVTELSSGKFAILLPDTRIFKANIVARRLRQAADKLSFQFADRIEKVSLAIGITSTESEKINTEYLSYGEYCIQAQHALNMSLETRNNYSIRFDETYEMTVLQANARQEDAPEDASEDIQQVIEPVFDTPSVDNIEILDSDDIFAAIISGDYSNVHASTLCSMIEPLEKFLEHAKRTRDEKDIREAV